MANTKVTQHVIANNAITADQLASAAVTHAKLHATMDLSGKTVTLPAVAIPSSSTGTTQSASDNTTKIATTAYVTTAISNLVDSAPAALDTLNEIAAALGDDANYASTTTAAIAAKLPLAGGTLTGNLVLSGAPSSGLHPATKTYTDTADALKLNLSGGTLTGDLILNTTTALKIPVGTTGQRPSAATGQIRWNTSDGALEVYNGSQWTAVGTGSSNKVLDTFTGNGSNRTFALTVTPANEDAIMVFIDGAYQEKGDYVLTNASLVLDTAPLANEKIAVHTTTASVHDGTSALNNQFTATANQTAFTLSQDPLSENNTQVYINGVYQQKTDYTVVGTTLTFDTGLTVGDVVEVNMFTVSTLGNTDTVSEGAGNLYHTTARARGAISVSGNAISYNSSTGVLSANFEEGPVFTGNVSIGGSAYEPNTDLNLLGDGLSIKNNKAGSNNNWSLIQNTDTGSASNLSFRTGLGVALTLNHNKSATFSGAVQTPTLIAGNYGGSGSDGDGFRLNSTDLYGQVDSSDKVRIAVAASSFFNGGNVGIGIAAPTERLDVEGSLVLNVASGSGLGEEGIFFRRGFSNSNKYNVSILNYAHDGAGNFSDGISINGYDGVSICTGSNNRQERMRIVGGTGSTSGNVGIGRIDPTQLLEVHKAAGGDQTVAKFSAHNYGDTGKTFIELGTENGDGSSRIGSFNDTGNKSTLVFQNHSASSGAFIETMRLASNGYIHMAGASDVRLTLGSQGTAGNNDANWVRGSGTSLSYNAASANHLWEIGGTEMMRLQANGHVGIGTGSVAPANKFNVQVGSDTRIGFWGSSAYGAIQVTNDANSVLKPLRFDSSEIQFVGGNHYMQGSNDMRIKLGDSGISGVSTSNNTVNIRGDNDYLKLNAAGNGGIIFEENGAERMRIASGGHVSINQNYMQVASNGVNIGRYQHLTCHNTITASNTWTDVAYVSYSPSLTIQGTAQRDNNGGLGMSCFLGTIFGGYGSVTVVAERSTANPMNGGNFGALEYRYLNGGASSGSYRLQVKLSIGSGTMYITTTLTGQAWGQISED